MYKAAQSVKNLSATQETWIQFLGWEDSLEKEMATHSSILAWKIPWTEEPGGYSPWGHRRVRPDLATQQQSGWRTFFITIELSGWALKP